MSSRPIRSMEFTRSNRPDPKIYRAISDIKKKIESNGDLKKYNKIKNNKQKLGKKQTKSGPKQSKIDGFVSRTIAQLQITLSNPLVAMMMAIIIFSVYTHYYNYDASVVKSIVDGLNSTESTKPLALWINSNVQKFFAVTATVAASLSLPADVMYSSMVIGVVVILMMPTAPITLYFIIIAFIVLYVRLKAKSDKFVVLIFAAIVMVYYNITMPRQHGPGLNLNEKIVNKPT